MTDDKTQLAVMIQKQCLSYGDFTLRSGAKSHFYLDLRKLTLSGNAVYAVKGISKTLAMIKYDSIGGPESAANQIIGACMVLNYCTTNRGFTVRKAVKDHGADDGLIVGNLQRNDRAVLVDDVGTKGGSLCDAVQAVRDYGAEVVCAVTIVDRKQGAAEALAKLGVDYRSVLTIDDLDIKPA